MSGRGALRFPLFGIMVAAFFAPAVLRAASISADGATCTLSNAILSANSDSAIGGCAAGSGADTIVLDADVVLATAVTAAIEGGPSGLPAIASAITIQAGVGETIERADGLLCESMEASAFRLLEVTATGDLTLVGLTLRNGCVAALSLQEIASGGAVLVLAGGRLQIGSCQFVDNKAVGAEGSTGPDGPARGGAIAVLDGKLTVSSSAFSDNQALGADAHGGAIAIEAGVVTEIRATQFEDNRVAQVPLSNMGSPSSGGALSFRAASVGALAHLLLRGNISGESQGSATGGAIEFSGGRLRELRDSSFEFNKAVAGNPGLLAPQSGRGGGLANSGVIEAITRTTFTANEAWGFDRGDGRGGGLDNRGRIDAITSSTFTNNLVSGGHGLMLSGGPSLGGGLANLGSIGTVAASTFVANEALQSALAGFAAGGGIYSGTDSEVPDDGLTVANALMAGNEAVNGSDCWSSAAFTSLGFNLAQEPDASCVFAASGDIVGEDPEALPAADNGCTVELPDGSCPATVAFLATSPAADAGNCSQPGTAIDGRGAVRPFDLAGVTNAPGGDGCDIGSYELDAPPATVHVGLTVAESIDPVVSGSGAENLVYTISLSSLGSQAANGIVVTPALPLPSGVSLDQVTPSVGSWNGTEWTIGSLPSGGDATLTLTLTVDFGAAGGEDVLSLWAAVTAATGHSGELASDVEATSVIEGVFFDGFEGGDTTGWSLTFDG